VSAGDVDFLSLELIERLDRHAAAAWPALISEVTSDGWILRASGGEGGRRLNTSLTPTRPLGPEEIESGLKRSAAFARTHRIQQRVQISPLHVHGDLVSAISARGWDFGPKVVVMSGQVAQNAADDSSVPADFAVSREADDDWLAGRARCNPDSDIKPLRRTVLPLLAGRAHFCRIGDRATGVAVASDGLVALFALAVAPDVRRQGLGTKLVRSMLAAIEADTAYLQVELENVGARALYSRLGFSDAFHYLHGIAPAHGDHAEMPSRS
jgi:ribosomal protein S18 acetylase RimI-like enzyme